MLKGESFSHMKLKVQGLRAVSSAAAAGNAPTRPTLANAQASNLFAIKNPPRLFVSLALETGASKRRFPVGVLTQPFIDGSRPLRKSGDGIGALEPFDWRYE